MLRSAFLFFFCISLAGFSQSKTDLKLIGQHQIGEKRIDNKLNTKTPLQTKHQSAIAKYNPVTLTFTGLMLGYQHIISPQLNATCVYSRSCSNFAKQAIFEYGIVKGVFLSADRLMRCNAQCENDIPSYAFDANGKGIDEPTLYRFK